MSSHPPHIDPDQLDFMTVDADTRFGDVLDLIGDLSPDHVVIREAPELRDEDDEDDDVFFVMEASVLQNLRADRDTLLGRIVTASARPEPAETVEVVSHATRGGGRPLGPSLTGGGLERVAAAAADAPAVVLAEGIPAAVVAAPAAAAPAPPAPGAAQAPPGNPPEEGGGDGGRPLGIAVDYARTVPLKGTLSLLISLTQDLADPDAIPVVAKVGDVLDVVVSPRSGFVVEGRAEGRLTVQATPPADADTSPEPLPILVRLRATALGPGEIVVYAFRDGSPLGSLTIAPTVLAEDAAATGEQARAEAELDDAPAADADLQLVILQERDKDGRPALRYLVTSRDPTLGLNLKPFGPTVLEDGPGGYFTALYREIERLPRTSDEQKADVNERLRAIGSTLFEQLLPEDLRTLLWGLRDRIDTVWIQSAEPYVPWELCRLEGKDADGRIVEGEFFCEAFTLTRWIPGLARVPELTLDDLGVIVPGDSGLAAVPAEHQMLHELTADGRKVTDITPRYREVRNALASAQYDGLHFSGHGSFPDPSNPAKAQIELEGGGRLRPSDIAGVAANLGLRKPIVFLNACQVGQQAPGLTGVGGWATALLSNGAAAFVGASWEVTDRLALTFAATFYARLVGGKTIAAAAHAARMAIRDAGDPTWLAYTVFADPGARLGSSTVTRRATP
jgi:CHAT domain